MEKKKNGGGTDSIPKTMNAYQKNNPLKAHENCISKQALKF